MEDTKKKGTNEGKKERKIEKQIAKIFGFLVLLVIIYLVTAAYFKSLNHFTYEGLSFSKERYGSRDVYHYYYFIPVAGGKPLQYNLYLKFDPRENDVPLEGDKVLFQKQRIFVTLDTNYPENCSDNLGGIVDLNQFLNHNQFEVVSGIMNESYAAENNKRYVTCENSSAKDEIIELFGSNRTAISIEGNCHRIAIGPECRIEEAIEKFKLQSVIDARELNLGNK